MAETVEFKDGDRVRRVGPHTTGGGSTPWGDKESVLGDEGTVRWGWLPRLEDGPETRVIWDRTRNASRIDKSALEKIEEEPTYTPAEFYTAQAVIRQAGEPLLEAVLRGLRA